MYDRWSLDVLYSGFDDPKFQSEFKQLDEYVEKFKTTAETLGTKDERTTTKEALTLLEESQKAFGRLINYCALRQNADTNDGDSVSYLGRLIQKNNEITPYTTAIEKYLASLKDLDSVIGDDEMLQDYSYYLHEMQKKSKYILSEDVETALGAMDMSGGNAWSDLQGYLTSSVKVDYKGETTTLSSIRNMAYDADPEVRKSAYEAEIAAYDKIKDAICFSLNSIKMQDLTECKLRGHASPLDKVLFNSKMQRATLDALLEAMKEYMPNFHSYLRAKAESLGHKNGLPWYDIFAPMGKAGGKVFTAEEAHAYLVEHFESFAPDLAEMVDEAFKNNWIDFYSRPGKSGGAFCSNLPFLKQSRILTNFSGSFGSVVTLAHELGHAYHGMMIQDHRPLNTGYTMPVAETASNFNELIIVNDAIAKSEGEEKIALIENQLQDCAQIIVDIYSRFLFEDEVIRRRKNTFMFAKDLEEIMINAQKEAFGDALDPEYMHPYMWCCKSHYYSAGLSYYNFPYAFGGLFSRGLYAKYLEEGESFLPKYRALLKATTVQNVEDVALIAGIDLTNPEFWRKSLDVIAEKIDEFIRVTGE